MKCHYDFFTDAKGTHHLRDNEKRSQYSRKKSTANSKYPDPAHLTFHQIFYLRSGHSDCLE